MASIDNANNVLEPLLEAKEPEEVVSSALEDILTNTELSKWKRLKSATFLEINVLYRLAAPAVVVYLLNNVTSMSTQIFCGYRGNLELAAANLGNTGIQTFAFGIMVYNPFSLSLILCFSLAQR
ncbi:hypothetical protein L6164_035883 [Bauhinia variegata]|uniref:Uncharacterized protein n=1 Tax=Bauhinia variegata TaxID=167791 RepID=A0ACB9KFC4_BAUVA|nr:hypothetical protein L6164_035883 [Bauhinia variegata]